MTPRTIAERASSRGGVLVFLGLMLSCGTCALGQSPESVAPADDAGIDGAPVVRWNTALEAQGPLRHGSAATVSVSGEVLDGWRVYALRQPSGGPTPLTLQVAANPVASAAGVASGTAPELKHDPSFDLDTRFYRRSFELRLPIAVKRHAAVGTQTIPVEVHYQSCSDRTCLPPATVRLSVRVTVLPET